MNWQIAHEDIQQSLSEWRIWCALAWLDIRQRYRRSKLGPFWLVISTAVTVCGIGFLFSGFFNQSGWVYIPYLALGVIFWGFISNMLVEGAQTLVQAQAKLLNSPGAYTSYFLRHLARQIIVLGHNAIIVVIVVLVYANTHDDFSAANLFWFIPGFIMAAITLLLWSVPLGFLCLRFRDFQQILQNIMQLAFFMSPIMWKKSLLTEHSWVYELNPFSHLLALLRYPLLGAAPEITSWLWVLALLLLGALVSLATLAHGRMRAIYWL